MNVDEILDAVNDTDNDPLSKTIKFKGKTFKFKLFGRTFNFETYIEKPRPPFFSCENLCGKDSITQYIEKYPSAEEIRKINEGSEFTLDQKTRQYIRNKQE